MLEDWTPLDPPPGAGPHCHVVVLYEQRYENNMAELYVKPVRIEKRVRWSLEGPERMDEVGEVVGAGRSV